MEPVAIEPVNFEIQRQNRRRSNLTGPTCITKRQKIEKKYPHTVMTVWRPVSIQNRDIPIPYESKMLFGQRTINRCMLTQRQHIRLLANPKRLVYDPHTLKPLIKPTMECTPRIAQLSRPKKRNVYHTWYDHSQTLPFPHIERMFNLLATNKDKCMSWRDAHIYLEGLRNASHKRTCPKRKEIRCNEYLEVLETCALMFGITISNLLCSDCPVNVNNLQKEYSKLILKILFQYKFLDCYIPRRTKNPVDRKYVTAADKCAIFTYNILCAVAAELELYEESVEEEEGREIEEEIAKIVKEIMEVEPEEEEEYEEPEYEKEEYEREEEQEEKIMQLEELGEDEYKKEEGREYYGYAEEITDQELRDIIEEIAEEEVADEQIAEEVKGEEETGEIEAQDEGEVISEADEWEAELKEGGEEGEEAERMSEDLIEETSQEPEGLQRATQEDAKKSIGEIGEETGEEMLKEKSEAGQMPTKEKSISEAEVSETEKILEEADRASRKIMHHVPDMVCCSSLKAWAEFISDVAQNSMKWVCWIQKTVRMLRQIACVVKGEMVDEYGEVLCIDPGKMVHYSNVIRCQIRKWNRYNLFVQAVTEKIIQCFKNKRVECCHLCEQQSVDYRHLSVEHVCCQLIEALDSTEYWRNWLDGMMKECQTLNDLLMETSISGQSLYVLSEYSMTEMPKR